MGAFKRGWCKPSAILFATECPPSERNFTVALAHAKESDAKLNLFHVAPSTARARMHYPGTNGAGPQTVLRVRQFFDPLAQRAWDMGIDCQVVLREGNAAEEILKYMGEWQVDRVVMGAHTAGPAGKPLVGSVADTLLRKAEVPVTIVSPFLAEGSYRNFLTRSVLCVVSAHQSSQAVARFAAELAMRYGARAVFQHIIPSQKQPDSIVGTTPVQVERQLRGMIPADILARANIHASVSIGDPAEELIYQGRALRANVIVIGAHDVTHLAPAPNAGYVYKVLAHATCPVIALSAVVLRGSVPETEAFRSSGIHFLPGAA
jgi:nucleotide-binding universal stress UspA family protein